MLSLPPDIPTPRGAFVLPYIAFVFSGDAPVFPPVTARRSTAHRRTALVIVSTAAADGGGRCCASVARVPGKPMLYPPPPKLEKEFR